MSVERIPAFYIWKALLPCFFISIGPFNNILAQADTSSHNYRIPKTEFRQDGLDLTLNEITFLHHVYPDLSGKGMNISIKENLFDTADIDFKNRIGSLAYASSHIDMHATNMATIAAGGGNTAPSAKGVAFDAIISSADFANLLPEPENYFLDNTISVQNHAYGTGIENFYGVETKAFDSIAHKLPWLVHVFSSGNAGESSPVDGPYAGITGWANLTGQFKQSKNTITAGAVDSLNHVVLLSSRGPAYDGRIKPEIVAYGHGGSSGAAAIVSGSALLLQEMYLKVFGNLPPSSLIKAILINSARDIETKGPDFISGFGSLKAYDAVRTLEENRFIIDIILQGEVVEIPVFIPSQIAQADFSIAWNDIPASPGSRVSLVNDIDIEVTDETGNIWLPWVLNANPHFDSLNLAAARGRDTLNNVEKISIDFPVSGNYTIRIKGSGVKTGAQQFSLAWDFKNPDTFYWTFPTRSDHLFPDSTNVIRWNSIGQQSGTVDYKLIGSDWMPLASIDDASNEYYQWRDPSITGLAQLRWTSSSGMVLSDTFVIANPLQPDVALWCTDSLIINWRDTGTNDTTEIFKLTGAHLGHHAYATDTFFVEYNPQPVEKYYAIAPVYNGIKGPLSYTIDYTMQGGGCYLNLFYELYVFNGIATFKAELSGIDKIEQVVLEENVNGVFVPILYINPVDSTHLIFQSGQLHQGINQFRLVVHLSEGQKIYSDVVSVYHVNDGELLLFPNPAKAGSDITLLTHSVEDFELRVFGMNGRQIYKMDLTSAPLQVPTLRLLAGIYIVQIVTTSGQHRSGLLEVIDSKR